MLQQKRICIALLFGVQCVFNGCYATHQSSIVRRAIKAKEKDQLNAESSFGWPAKISVEFPKGFSQTNNDLIHDLQKTGLFDDVKSEDKNVVGTALIVEIKETVNSQNPLPLLTIVTLGFFPTIWRDQYGHKFVLRKPSTHKTVEIDFPVRTVNIMGWLAAPMLLFPGWTREAENPRNRMEYLARFKLALLSKRPEINGLISEAISQPLTISVDKNMNGKNSEVSHSHSTRPGAGGLH